jgi:regulation of enolase protein 1 (concanavalin A-like superfamily)
LIDKITNYVKENLGTYPFKKITVSQTDYERNPFYGLNQLPAFISPFPDEFLFEIKFLKTYLNNYLHNTIRLNPRNDNWI